MEEIWKNIVGYIGLYEVSNLGKVKRFYKSKRSRPFIILSPGVNDKHGHLFVHLSKNGIKTKYYIHRLVLMAFIGPCPIGMECRHLDGNPSNNRLDNLCWGTRKENQDDRILHGTDNRGSRCVTSKLNELQVRIIKRLLKDNYLTPKEIAEIFNVHIRTIYGIKNGYIWKHIKRED